MRLGEWDVANEDKDCVGNLCLPPVQDFPVTLEDFTIHPDFKYDRKVEYFSSEIFVWKLEIFGVLGNEGRKRISFSIGNIFVKNLFHPLWSKIVRPKYFFPLSNYSYYYRTYEKGYVEIFVFT